MKGRIEKCRIVERKKGVNYKQESNIQQKGIEREV